MYSPAERGMRSFFTLIVGQIHFFFFLEIINWLQLAPVARATFRCGSPTILFRDRSLL